MRELRLPGPERRNLVSGILTSILASLSYVTGYFILQMSRIVLTHVLVLFPLQPSSEHHETGQNGTVC